MLCDVIYECSLRGQVSRVCSLSPISFRDCKTLGILTKSFVYPGCDLNSGLVDYSNGLNLSDKLFRPQSE